MIVGQLIIDWENLPTYNTIMSVAAGAGLIMVVRLGRSLLTGEREASSEGYSMAFAVVGSILTITGAHMTLTWPLAPDFPFDNIIFGEPALAFGVLLLAAAFFGWRRGPDLMARSGEAGLTLAVLRPVSPFVFGLGLSCLAIAAAGVAFELFAAPPQEPITGLVTEISPWIEIIFMSAVYAIVGVGGVLFPLVVRGNARAATVTGWAWAISGWIFLLFGAYNFFTHIGLIVNTMAPPQ